MKSNHMRGRSITNDSAVLSLFQSINNMHPQLLDILNQLDEKRRERLNFCLFSNDNFKMTSSLQVKTLQTQPLTRTTVFAVGSVLRGTAG